MTNRYPVFLHDSFQNRLLPSPDKEHLDFYACGITPYSAAHVGHARSYVVFDAMVELFQHSGHNVRFVRNITDIDDKIIAKANETGQAWNEVSDFWAKDNQKHMSTLLCKTPEEPKASDFIDGILSLTKTLLDKKFAYIAENGDVLFDAAKYEGRGLVQVDVKNAPKRVESEHKKSAQDFVLWKMAKPHEPSFESPWGAGRPGWHIECSAMIKELLGETIDYHGGGVDLRFPHHHAETLQSECAHGAPLANHWLHHGSVRDGLGQKMSKSLGNVVLIDDALQKAEEISGSKDLAGVLLRTALLSSLWTKPLDYSTDTLTTAWNDLLTFASALPKDINFSFGNATKSAEILRDNFNTPKLRVHLYALSKKKTLSGADQEDLLAGLFLLGVRESHLTLLWNHAQQNENVDINPEIEFLMNERERLRRAGQFAEADLIRDKMKDMGVLVSDKPMPKKSM